MFLTNALSAPIIIEGHVDALDALLQQYDNEVKLPLITNITNEWYVEVSSLVNCYHKSYGDTIVFVQHNCAWQRLELVHPPPSLFSYSTHITIPNDSFPSGSDDEPKFISLEL